jgi:glucose-1-phosphate adenylyltransferase
MAVDRSQRIKDFLEKPENPPAVPWDQKQSLISMGVYLFRTNTLVRALIQDAKSARSSHDFGRDIIPRLIERAGAYAYPFDGYWEDIGTIDAFWKANMSFLSSSPPFYLNDRLWLIRTHQTQHGPSFLTRGDIRNSIISSGCRIQGGTVRHSILSPGVQIGPGAEVVDSIVFEGARIGRGARLRRAIVDKFSQVPDHFAIGHNEKKDMENFIVSEEGICVIPKNWGIK